MAAPRPTRAPGPWEGVFGLSLGRANIVFFPEHILQFQEWGSHRATREAGNGRPLLIKEFNAAITALFYL